MNVYFLIFNLIILGLVGYGVYVLIDSLQKNDPVSPPTSEN